MVTFSELGQYGRLGNQLFQIAGTICIAKENGHEFVFPPWDYADFFENRLPEGMIDNAIKIKQKKFNYYKINISQKFNWDLKGFFQSEKFFINQKELIRFYFKPSVKIEEYIRNKYGALLSGNTCSLHVRRGDYLKQSYAFPAQTIEYYLAAIKLMGNNSKFLVFSDDIHWCRKNFNGDNFYFIENETDIVDLFVMSYCKNHIISNSSFSWWGAWLNNSETKKVLCPETWFGPAAAFNVEKTFKDIFSANFQKVILPKTGNFEKQAWVLDPLIFIFFQIKIPFIYLDLFFVKAKRRLNMMFGKYADTDTKL